MLIFVTAFLCNNTISSYILCHVIQCLLSEGGLHLLSCSVDSFVRTHQLGVGCAMVLAVDLRGGAFGFAPQQRWSPRYRTSKGSKFSNSM